MFLNGASSVASIFTQQGKKGTNQDAMIVWENFGSKMGTVFCGVFDGHGPYGHMVARKVRDSLPLKLNAQWEVNSEVMSLQNNISTQASMNSEKHLFAWKMTKTSIDFDEEKLPEFFITLKESFLKAFKTMDKELKLHPNIDCFCSGTTAVTIVKQGQDLVIGNVGDSRAILGTRDDNNNLIAVQLTVDLKPNLPKEAERIKRYRGRVFALRDEPEVARVWLPNYDSPGLAMARAFETSCLMDFGLISGIWDVLSNEEVVEIVASSPARSTAARSLVEHAVRAWRFKYPTSKVDDCAVVCLFLDNDEFETNELSREEPPPPRFVISKPELSALSNGMETPASLKDLQGDGDLPRSPPELPDDSSESMEGGEHWFALEGVTRANTLLNLPRFDNVEQQQHAGAKAKKK
ncbi:hypothetical protein HPP92_024658 [Vanilla planifolia]|uniref:protein-serine/threonine phosphatase n=1 Tax=Vanilla planifolia TaxID=51239 RepID=A0A835UDH0_VANPL|nr:hypothetical protein HPP92_024658 [Vanilla planifolia]